MDMKHHGYCPPSVGITVGKQLATARVSVLRGESVDVAVAQVVAGCARVGIGDLRTMVVRYAGDVQSMFNLANYRGYCYLWLVKPVHRITMAIAMGPSPTIMALMRWQDDRVWAVSAWDQLAISPGGIADFHIEPKRSDMLDAVDLIDALLYMQVSASVSLSGFWKEAVLPKEFSCKLNLYSTVGAPKLQKTDMAEKLAIAYSSVIPSVGAVLKRIIYRDQFAVVASLYAGNEFPVVSAKTMLTGTLGRALVQYPPMATNGLFVLPPGFYYIGDGFRVGSEDVVTVLLVPAGVSMRVCSEESRFRLDLPDPDSFQLYYRDCSKGGFLQQWWESVHNVGSSSDGHFVRSLSNVLIHNARTMDAARGVCVEVSEPLDEYKSLEIYRYSGVVDAGGVCHVGCASIAPYTVLTGFRSTANAELAVGNAVMVHESEARVALSAKYPLTVTVVDQRDDDVVRHQATATTAFTFLLESVADSYSYDCEYDSDMSNIPDTSDFSPIGIEGTSNWYEDQLPRYSELDVSSKT